MALADLKIVGVVRGGDLHASCTEFPVYILVGDDGNFSAHKRKNQHFADHVLISLVIGMNRDSGIAEEGFGRVVAISR